MGKDGEVETSPSQMDGVWQTTKKKLEMSPAVESTKLWVSTFSFMLPCSSHPIIIAIYPVTVN